MAFLRPSAGRLLHTCLIINGKSDPSRLQERFCPRPADPLVSLGHRVGTFRSPGEAFVDGPYIFRPVWENYIDYGGVLRSPDEEFTDNVVTFKSRDKGFGDRGGIYHSG